MHQLYQPPPGWSSQNFHLTPASPPPQSLFFLFLILSSYTIVILFYLAACFSFSIDYRKFRTLQQNWFSKHVNMIMCNFFMNWLQVQAKQITNCQLSVTTSSLTHLLPISLTFSLCTLTPSRQLCYSADTQILHIPHVRTRTFGQHCFSNCVPKQQNSLPSDAGQIQSSHAFKIALKTHLCKKYRKWFQILSPYLRPPPPPPPISSVQACVHVHVVYYNYLFLRF